MPNDELEEELQQEEIDLWENRRKMAWRAFNIGVLYIFSVLGFMFFASTETVKSATELGTVAIAALGFFGGVVMAYIGAATWSDNKK